MLLALIVFAGSYCLAVLSSFFFARSDFRLWVIAGRVMTKTQFLTWAGYLVFFLVFYIVNSMVVNSGRMRNMSDGKNLLICALFNVAGVFVFELFVYAFELITGQMVWYGFGKDYFLYAVVLYPMIVVAARSRICAQALQQDRRRMARRAYQRNDLHMVCCGQHLLSLQYADFII